MDKDKLLKLIEDLIDASNLDLKDYCVKIKMDDSGYWVDICRCDKGPIKNIEVLSEIFNQEGYDWEVTIHDERHLHIIIK